MGKIMSRGFLLSALLIVLGVSFAFWGLNRSDVIDLSSKKINSAAVRHLDNAVVLKNQIPARSVASTNTERKMTELDQILDSKNDNDPRLDSDFKVLDEDEKRALREKYVSYAPERFNEKGTLVFLIGRNIKTEDDVKFMDGVLKEPPCLSMQNCKVESAKAHGEAAHTESINSVTLAYPQIVTIRALESYLLASKDSPLTPTVMSVLQGASHSRSSVVASFALDALKKISP